MKTINSFLWLCSGVSQSILKRCPTEGAKYAGIGAIILFTGIFAALAAGYATYTVFDNLWYSTVFGILWGVMIFNLDRYIVSSMKKRNNFMQEFYMALPRIILAILISIIISKPLEMKIFDKEIGAELVIMEQEIFKKQEEGINSRYANKISSLQAEVAQLKDEINIKTSQRNELLKIAQQEADGTGGSMKKNLGPIYKVKKENADKAETELLLLKSKNNPLISAKEKQIDKTREQVTTDTNQLERSKYNGFAARIDALSRLKDNSTAIKWTDWFMFLLFIALETAPIFVKLISNKGPYDELLEAHEHRYKTRNVDIIANQTHSTKVENEHLSETERVFINDKLSAYLKNNYSSL